LLSLHGEPAFASYNQFGRIPDERVAATDKFMSAVSSPDRRMLLCGQFVVAAMKPENELLSIRGIIELWVALLRMASAVGATQKLFNVAPPVGCAPACGSKE
jgi:hypothetical protein